MRRGGERAWKPWTSGAHFDNAVVMQAKPTQTHLILLSSCHRAARKLSMFYWAPQFKLLQCWPKCHLAVGPQQNISTALFPSKNKGAHLAFLLWPVGDLKEPKKLRVWALTTDSPGSSSGVAVMSPGNSKMSLWSKEEQYCWKFGEKRWRSGLEPNGFGPPLLIQMFHF